MKITGGVHTGCLRIQAGAGTDIKTVDDLKGKTIGVPAPFGSPPHMFATRVLAAHGIDPKQDSKDIKWKAIQGGALEAALKNGDIQAVADSEPLGSRFVGHGAVKAGGGGRPAAGRPVQGRVLLRHRRQRPAGAEQPGGGGQGDARPAQGGQVGQSEPAGGIRYVDREEISSPRRRTSRKSTRKP